jgi:hypothetical protein
LSNKIDMRQKPNFPGAYKDDLFRLWFNNQQPSIKKLHQMIPEEWGEKPTLGTLQNWHRIDFKPKAERLKREYDERLSAELIQEKVEMLRRHGALGRQMQQIALDCLDNVDPTELSEHAAVRMLVEGVRIERDSVGIPQTLEKLLNQTDEELIEEIQKLIGDSQAVILED